MSMVTEEFMIPIFYKGYRAENKYSNRGNYEAALNFQKIINEAYFTYPNITCRLYNIDERNSIIHLARVARQKRNIPFLIPFLISCCQQDHLNSSLDIIQVQRPELNIIYSNSRAKETLETQKYSKYSKYSNSYLYSKILGHKYFPSYYGEIYRTEDDHRRTLNVFQRMLGVLEKGSERDQIVVNVGVYNRPDVVPDQIRDYDNLIHKMIKENETNNSWRQFYSKPKVSLKFVLLGSSDVRFTFDTKYINYITTDPNVFYKDIDLYLYPTIKNSDPIPNSQVICALNRIPIATNTVHGVYSSKDELQFCTNEVTETTVTKPQSYQDHLSLINEAFRGMFVGSPQTHQMPQINMFMLDTNQGRAKQLLQETKDAILALLKHLKK